MRFGTASCCPFLSRPFRRAAQMTLPIALLAAALGAPPAPAADPLSDDATYERFLEALRETNRREFFRPSPEVAQAGSNDAAPDEAAASDASADGDAEAIPARESDILMNIIAPGEGEEEEAREFKPYLPPVGDPFAKRDDMESEIDKETRLLFELLADRKVTLNFKDADLQNVIRVMARQAGLNLVIPPDIVQGQVTLYLDDVPIMVALNSLLRANELAFVVEQSGIIRIVPLERVEDVDDLMLMTVHVPLNWVKAEALRDVLRPILVKFEGEIASEESSNAVIITAPPPALERVRDVIRRIDVPDKQVEIETRFYEMSDSAGRELGVAWDVYRRDEEFNSPDRRAFSTNVFIPEQTDEETGEITPAQWQVLTEPGVPVDSLGFNRTIDPVLGTVGFPFSGAGGGVWSWGETVQIFDQDFELGVQLRAFESRGEARTLANPRLTTLNNVPAEVDLTTQRPYQEIVIGDGGDRTARAVFKDIGLRLIVTPMITNHGYVRLNVITEQYNFEGIEFVSDLVGNVPVVSTRKSNTNVIVESDETAALFGLRQLETQNDTGGIPWLHRLPFFGWAFKNKDFGQTRRDLALFLTPHVIQTPGIDGEDQTRYDEIDLKWDLPDYFFDDVRSVTDK